VRESERECPSRAQVLRHEQATVETTRSLPTRRAPGRGAPAPDAWVAPRRC
jgi:hypothetical protein